MNNQAPPQGKGRVYLMNKAQAEENGNVITGYFNVLSMPAFTLFDNGATYSLVSREFSKKLKLYLTISDCGGNNNSSRRRNN